MHLLNLRIPPYIHIDFVQLSLSHSPKSKFKILYSDFLVPFSTSVWGFIVDIWLIVKVKDSTNVSRMLVNKNCNWLQIVYNFLVKITIYNSMALTCAAKIVVMCNMPMQCRQLFCHSLMSMTHFFLLVWYCDVSWTKNLHNDGFTLWHIIMYKNERDW